MGKTHDIQERTFTFACRVVDLYEYLLTRRGSARALARQLLKSGTSIGANMQEADAAESKPDFISKCNIALKEARETHYWLRLISRCRGVATERLADLLKEANEIVSILTAIRKRSRGIA